MNIYFKKIYNHDITHQISITKEISSSFFVWTLMKGMLL